jgi:glutamyl-tRNA synthetase
MTGQILDAASAILNATTSPWDKLDVLDVLQKERERLGLPPRVFMTVLRHALCGMKVSTNLNVSSRT